jgi:oligopeptide/dipeptide ABC transporter ATP-binding protein
MKDYGAEAEKLTAFVHQYGRSTGNRLLDVACGTGLHLSYLKQHFQVEGLDLDEQLLAIARQRNPKVPLHHADMTDFDLGRTFDVPSLYTHTRRPCLPPPSLLHPDEAKEEVVLMGEVPSALHPPSGCHFHPRCPFAMPQCAATEPALVEVSPGHQVACHLY